MYRRTLIAGLLAAWAGTVVFIALLMNRWHLREGPTLLVLDRARGWGLHRMDIEMVAVAMAPVALAGVVGTIRWLFDPPDDA